MAVLKNCSAYFSVLPSLSLCSHYIKMCSSIKNSKWKDENDKSELMRKKEIFCQLNTTTEVLLIGEIWSHL
jgi:hypothetical protein